MSQKDEDVKKYLIKNNMSGETVSTTTDLELAKNLADAGGVWLWLKNGLKSFRWYAQDEDGNVVYSPKDKR